MLSVLLVILILTTLGLLWLRSKQGKLPPGPKRVPLLGSIPYIKFTHGLSDFFLNESITQHKIATLDMGPMRQFVINDFELAKVRKTCTYQFAILPKLKIFSYPRSYFPKKNFLDGPWITSLLRIYSSIESVKESSTLKDTTGSPRGDSH